MKPFRLGTVERLRAARLESAGRDVQAAIVALGAARTKIEQLTAALERGDNPALTSPAGVTSSSAYRERIRAQLTEAAEQLAGRERELAEAQTAWRTAKAQLRAVTALHDRHREAVRAEQLHREQLELDDLAGSRPRGPAHGTGAGVGGPA